MAGRGCSSVLASICYDRCITTLFLGLHATMFLYRWLLALKVCVRVTWYLTLPKLSVPYLPTLGTRES